METSPLILSQIMETSPLIGQIMETFCGLFPLKRNI